jgi:hypothetical protein
MTAQYRFVESIKLKEERQTVSVSTAIEVSRKVREVRAFVDRVAFSLGLAGRHQKLFQQPDRDEW